MEHCFAVSVLGGPLAPSSFCGRNKRPEADAYQAIALFFSKVLYKGGCKAGQETPSLLTFSSVGVLTDKRRSADFCMGMPELRQCQKTANA